MEIFLTIFPKNAQQFAANKGNESMARHGHLHLKGHRKRGKSTPEESTRIDQPKLRVQ